MTTKTIQTIPEQMQSSGSHSQGTGRLETRLRYNIANSLNFSYKNKEKENPQLNTISIDWQRVLTQDCTAWLREWGFHACGRR